MEPDKNRSDENVMRKIQELLKGNTKSLNILEEKISVELQMEYFEMAKKVRAQLKKEDLMEKTEALNDPETSVDDAKYLLCILAASAEISAYRKVEEFVDNASDELRDWALLALQESKMHVESSLLDQDMVYISTGLGGKGTKLRYFVVLSSKDKEHFTPVQQKIIENELKFSVNKSKGELEKVDFVDYTVRIVTLLPIDTNLRDLFKQTIAECNTMGDFMHQLFIITNVKELDNKEIKEYIDKTYEPGYKDAQDISEEDIDEYLDDDDDDDDY